MFKFKPKIWKQICFFFIVGGGGGPLCRTQVNENFRAVRPHHRADICITRENNNHQFFKYGPQYTNMYIFGYSGGPGWPIKIHIKYGSNPIRICHRLYVNIICHLIERLMWPAVITGRTAQTNNSTVQCTHRIPHLEQSISDKLYFNRVQSCVHIFPRSPNHTLDQFTGIPCVNCSSSVLCFKENILTKCYIWVSTNILQWRPSHIHTIRASRWLLLPIFWLIPVQTFGGHFQKANINRCYVSIYLIFCYLGTFSVHGQNNLCYHILIECLVMKAVHIYFA